MLTRDTHMLAVSLLLGAAVLRPWPARILRSAVSLATIILPTAVAPSIHHALRPARALVPTRLHLAGALHACTVVVCGMGLTMATVCGAVGAILVVVVGCSGGRRLLRDKHRGVGVQLCRPARGTALECLLVMGGRKDILEDAMWGYFLISCESIR